MPVSLVLTTAATCFGLMLFGGGIYEGLVVDPVWPKHPETIQPSRGGISRGRFWLPIHILFEISLICAVIGVWPIPSVRSWLLVALISHAARRIWSASDFIPKALAFERAEPGSISEVSARKWTRRSTYRLPLSLFTCVAMIGAVLRLARLS